jgi:hypothetical protein
MMASLQWLYDEHPRDKEASLLDAMELLHNCGWNWEDWFVEGVYPKENIWDLEARFEGYSDQNFQYLHGVNVGEGWTRAFSCKIEAR